MTSSLPVGKIIFYAKSLTDDRQFNLAVLVAKSGVGI